MTSQKFKFRKHLLFFLLVDAVLFTICYAGAYLLRFDLKFPHSQYFNFKNTLVPIILIKVLIFYYYGLYRGLWRYTGLEDLTNIIKASVVSSTSIMLLILITYRFEGMARSVFFIDGLLTVFLTGGFRLGFRIAFRQNKQGTFRLRKHKQIQKTKKKVLIVGAGDAGEKILREINENVSLGYDVVGFLDDDLGKIDRYIHRIKVLGSISDIAALTKKIAIDEIIIAIPSVSGEKMRCIVSLCQQTGVRCKTIPSIGELINGQVNLASIRDISYADLLGRTQVELDMDKIGAYLSGKRVLVTGAGGSIGSECCRQIARFKPQNLIMLDRAESSLYDIEMEIKRFFPQQDSVPVLSSITCLERLRKIFDQYKPQVVFHAAAYKHVPMMEMYPWEGVYNNIVGTKNLLETALKTGGVERFVSISTDKAVRPTNIMGACKRVAELIIQLKHKEIISRAGSTQTKIMAVRFGNVIGSAGSVIPLFKKQIANGGPVTVTHPEVTRYFMTINEAVQLVLQAAAIGEGGEIYILKMGEPVKIIDMARDLIRLYGLKPDEDIRLEITGLRPGEKLYEELITEGEGIVPTPHKKLMVLRSNNGSNGHNNGNGLNGGANGNGSRTMAYSDLEKMIEKLLVAADRNDVMDIKLKMKEIVPEYNTQELVQKESKFECKKIIELVNKKRKKEMVLKCS